MKPWELLGEARMPDGTDLKLQRRDTEYQRQRDAERDAAPRLARNVAGRHRLRLARPIGGGQPQPGGQRAFLPYDPARRLRRLRTGSR